MTALVGAGFWEELARVDKSGEWSREDAKIGLGTLGLMYEVLNPGQRVPAPVEQMVNDVLAGVLSEKLGEPPEENAERVASFVRNAMAVNPLLKRFGADLARAWAAAEELRRSAGRNAIGAEPSAPPSEAPAKSELSPLAARIAQLRK